MFAEGLGSMARSREVELTVVWVGLLMVGTKPSALGAGFVVV